MEDDRVNLPPGFQFDPTDEELILNFLYRKAASLPCYPDVIPNLDLHSCHPAELNDKAFSSRQQWYFFSQMMENRVMENGYWKQLDIDEPIFTTARSIVGIKKFFVFYIGEAPGGIQTNWIMQEYHLPNLGFTSKHCQQVDSNKWVLCRVHEGSCNSQGIYGLSCNDESELSYLDEVFLSMDDDHDEISSPY